MSSTSILEPYVFSESSSESSSLLPSFIKSDTGVRSAGPRSIDPTDLHLNFLAFLALAQYYHIDLLPISWQPALDTGLSGRTAKISEALVNLQLNLIFKRLQPYALDEAHTFKALISEILILAQPAFANHPNILKLEGICWEVSSTNHDVLPVLVFEKAHQGDLRRFLCSPEGQKLPFQDRLCICIDIGNAIGSMHASHVIHGDIKPENVLIFRNKTGQSVAKVSDFGFSTMTSTSSASNEILLPRSRPWNAPEWHSRGFSFMNAMKTDVYSFGLLSLFVLFKEKLLKDLDLLGSDLEGLNCEPGIWSWSDTDRQNYCLQQLRRKVDLQDYVAALVEDVDILNAQRKADFREFFRLGLDVDPWVRVASFQPLMSLLAGERSIPPPPIAIEGTEQPSIHKNFELSQNMLSLAKADYRVRKYLVKCFEEQASHHGCESCRRSVAFQLSVCCLTGFGIECSKAQSMLWLERSGRRLEDLYAQVEQVRTTIPDWPYYNERMTDLHNHGFLKTIDYADDHPQADVAASIISTYYEEIESLSEVMGTEHTIVMVLRDILISFFRAQGDLEQAATMRNKLQKDLEQSQQFGPDHLDTLASVSDLAEIYRSQGMYDLASSMNRQALKGRESLLGKTHPITMVSVNNLAIVLQAQGKNDEAEILNRELLGQREQTLGLDHPATLTSMNNLALVLQSSGDYGKTIELHERVLERCQRAFGADHVSTFMSLSNLASSLSEQGDLSMAEQNLREALKGFERLLGEKHPCTITSMGNLASVLQLSQNYAESEQLYRRTLNEQCIVLGTDHPETLSTTSNLALVLSAQGDLDAAQQLHEVALAGMTKTLGKDHVTTLKSVGHLAAVLQAKGDHTTAETLHRQALSGLKMRLGDEHSETLACLEDLALTMEQQNKLEESEVVYRRVLEKYEKTLGSHHPSTIGVLSSVASVLQDQGKYALAEDLHHRVLSGCHALWGEDNPETLMNIENLASVLQDQGRHGAALQLHQRVLRIKETTYGRDDPDTLESVRNVAVALQELKKFDLAESMYQRELETRRNTLGLQHPDTLEALESFSQMLWEAEKFESAIEMSQQACDIYDVTLGRDHPRTLTTVGNMAYMLHRQRCYEEAGAAYQRACNGFERVLSKDHPLRKECLRRHRSMMEETASREGRMHIVRSGVSIEGFF